MNNLQKIKLLVVLGVVFFTNISALIGQAPLDSLAEVQNIDSLINTSLKLLNEGKPAEAMQMISEAVFRSEEHFGQKHPIYSSALGSKGRMLVVQRKYAEAETCLNEALAAREVATGKENQGYATILYNLGSLYLYTNRIPQAEETFLEAKSILEKIGAGKTDIYCRLMSDFSYMYQLQAQYEKAEKAALQAKGILEETGRTNEIAYLVCIVNLGAMSYALNQMARCIQYFEEAAEGFKRANLTSDSRYAVVLTNLGLLYSSNSDFEKAKNSYLEAQVVLEKSVGKSSFEYAQLMLNTAGTYYYLEDYDNAEKYFLESKAIYEQVGQATNILYFRALSSLGKVYVKKGHLVKAEIQFKTVLKSWSAEVGESDDYFLDTEILLAETLFRSGKHAEADSFLVRASLLEKKLLNRASAHFSQNELLTYLPLVALSDKWFGTFARSGNASEKSFVGAYENAVLFRKGYFLQSSQMTNQMVAAADENTRQKYDLWKSHLAILEDGYSQPLTSRSINIDSIEYIANTLEKQLLQNLPGFSEARRDVQWQEVQAALKPGEAAIEFVVYEDQLADQTGHIHYAALVLRPGTDAPVFVPLFEEDELVFLTNRSKSWLQDYIEKLYAYRQNGNLKSIYQLVWKPLEKELSGVTTLYYAPVGLLHRLNLEAAQTEDGKRMSDRFQSVVLGSTRQLVVPAAAPSTDNRTAMVLGGIRYEAGTATGQTDVAFTNTTADNRSLSFEDADSTLRGNDWSYLPATEKEVRSVDKLLRKNGFKTEIWTGFEATEESVKAAGTGDRSPRIVHIATHGFFFPDPKSQEQADSTAPVFKVSDNPMIRSGLLLANANQAWKTGKPAGPDKEDGILTAYEISQLNLQQTELVVLSACETGLGAIEGNEGVYGLQRAFKIAGAQYLIMSLWKVDDNRTQDLMAVFYENWLDKGLAIPEAFEKAKATMRQKHPNPFYWAGFVLVE